MRQIYAILDPDTAEWRYIGASVDPMKRLRVHRSGGSSGDSLTAWLQALPELPPVEVLDEAAEDWREVEARWILAAWHMDAPLLNVHQIPGRAAAVRRAAGDYRYDNK